MAKAKAKTTKRKTAKKTAAKTNSRAAKSKTSKKKTGARAAKKSTTKKGGAKKGSTVPVSKSLSPKAATAVRKAADSLWEAGVTPHKLLQELHEVLLLKCLKEADGNYALAASKFGPSRQSVQQYANSSLRDDRWKPYQQNRRKQRSA